MMNITLPANNDNYYSDGDTDDLIEDAKNFVKAADM